MHIFISYSHKDADKRDNLIDVLKQQFEENEISWDRERLGSGEEWSERLDQELDDAFVIVLVLTDNIRNSDNVTYEWAWALGHGLVVIPVYWEEVPLDVHHRLKRINWLNFLEDTEKLLDDLLRIKDESPLVKYTKQSVTEKITPLIVFTTLFFWIHNYDDVIKSNYQDFSDLSEKVFHILLECYGEELPRFWLNYSHAFSPFLKRQLEDLIDTLYKFWQLLNPYNTDIQNRVFLISDEVDKYNLLLNYYNDKLYPLMEYFSIYKISFIKEYLEAYFDENRFLEENLWSAKLNSDLASDDLEIIDKFLQLVKSSLKP